MEDKSENSKVIIGLSAVIIGVENDRPGVFIVKGAEHSALRLNSANNALMDALPFGLFDPEKHSTLEKGLLAWVNEQTPIALNYVEQLYTFSNRTRFFNPEAFSAQRILSIGYIALTNEQLNDQTIHFADWYKYFPWEDWRAGKPLLIEKKIVPLLKKWADAATDKEEKKKRQLRSDICFGIKEYEWDEEKVLQRYELLYEAELIQEALLDKNVPLSKAENLVDGDYLFYDHRRILATAIGRLRGKLKYRPVIYELMPQEFTLLRLQKAMEAILGKNMHKQNFRRFVESSGMIEEVEGKTSDEARGRPAALFKFKREVAAGYFL